MSDSRLQLRRVAWERSAACEVETPVNRDPELDRKIPLSLQHVATSHKWVSQSQLNSHQEIHGNGLQGLAIQRQVASYNHSTMWHWGFIMRQSRSYRKTAVSKKRLSQLWPLLLFFFFLHALYVKMHHHYGVKLNLSQNARTRRAHAAFRNAEKCTMCFCI